MTRAIVVKRQGAPVVLAQGSQLLTSMTAQATRAASAAAIAAVLAQNSANAAQALTNYRSTLAEGVSDFAVGEFFSSAETGELRLYKRIVGSPFYEDQGDDVVPITKGYLLGASPVAPVAGETGVINDFYPVGDVRRYGVFPDGVTNWESTYPARITAIFANSILTGITIYWPPGDYATSLNIGVAYSGSKMFFDHAVFYGIVHWVSGVSYLSWLGVFSTYDRFGITAGGCTGCRAGTIICLSDPAKNVATVGGAGRGAHIVAASDFQFDLIDVVDCGAAAASLPGDPGNMAAVFIESQGQSGTRGRIRVRQSQTNGVFINGLDIDVDIIVEGYGAQAIDVGSSSLEGLSNAETELGTGVMLHRCTGRARYKVTQSNASPAADTYSVLIPETGVSTVATSRHKPLEISYHDVTVGNGNRGVCIGSANGAYTVVNVAMTGPVTTRLRTANTLAATYAGFNVLPPPASPENYRRLTVLGELEFSNFSALQEFNATAVATAQVRNYTELNIGGIKTDTGAGPVVKITGLASTGGILKGRIGYINITKSQGGSAASSVMVDIDGTTGFVLVGGNIESSSDITMCGLRLRNNVSGQFAMGTIRRLGATGDLAALTIEANTSCKIGPCKMTRAAPLNSGVVFVGTNTDCIFEGLVPEASFGDGFKNGTGITFTRCVAIGCIAQGNTDDTDLTVGMFPAANQLGCTNFAI